MDSLNLEKILFDYFGFEKFKDGQREIIEAIISGNNTLAILPTGGGKSLCYQLPALIADKPSIVVSPMISLMKDQVDKLNAEVKRAGFVNSSQTWKESELVLHNLFEGKIKLLYISPEKITSPKFVSRLQEINWQYLFVDEAHCISEWGHNFRPSYLKISEFATSLDFSSISAFTATATPEVRKDIIFRLELENPKIFVRGFARENLSLNVLSPKDKKSKLATILRSNELPAIVYCSTRKETEEVADFLRLHGFVVNHYHAGLSSEMRRLIQDDFIKDKLEVIVATNAFGMGIDKKDIRTIVHFNIPQSIEHYYQEIGRAGRDGKSSKIYLLYSRKDFAIHEYLIQNSFPNDEEIRTVYSGISDYARVALGSSYEGTIQIDKGILKFFEAKKIGKAKLENALRSLEEAGYLKIFTPRISDYKIKYQLTPPDLKNYIKKIAKKEFAEVLIALAKLYLAKPFNEPTKISLERITNATTLNITEVKETLRLLDLKGIIFFEEPSEFISVKLTRTRIRPEDLQFTNERNEKLVAHAISKLRKIKDYAETNSCRMDFILKYFGEDKNYQCGKCDNCLSSDVKDETLNDYVEEVIIETINALNQKISVRDFIQLLIGKQNIEFLAKPNFGALKDFSTIEIDEAIYSLEARGKIKINSNFILPAEKRITRQKTNADYEKELVIYNKLAELRKETSKKFNQPIYMICSDQILRDIVKAKPTTEFELLSVKGFTRTMFNKFGKEILEFFQKHKIS